MRWSVLTVVALGCGIPQYQTPPPGACAEPTPVENQWLPAGHAWPDAPAWPAPSDLDEPGIEVGDVIPNFRRVDQNGDEVCLWEFYGRVTLVDISAIWCEPCQKAAAEAACTARDYGADDFVYLTVHGDGNPPGTLPHEQVVDWAEFFGLTEPNTPVVGDENWAWSGAWTDNPPSFVLVDRELRIQAIEHGFNDTETPDMLREWLTDATGVEPAQNSCEAEE